MFYSACIPAIFGNLPIEESLAHVREAGLRHYEFWGWDLSQIDAYAAAQSRYGLTPAALCTTVHDLTDPSRRDAYLQGLRETLPVCQKLGCRIIISQVLSLIHI